MKRLSLIVLLAFFLFACTDNKAAELVAPESSVFVSGADWKACPGNVVTKDGEGFQMSSNLKKCKSVGNTQGIFISVPKKVEAQVSGRKIKVSVIAKAAKGGSGQFAVAYSTAQVGNSGWRNFTSTPEYAVYSFEYAVPKMKKTNMDFIGVWADVNGKGRGIVVKSAYVEFVN